MSQTKTFKEEGIVVLKTIKPAFNTFTNKEGNEVPGQGERYVVSVASLNPNSVEGEEVTLVDYKIEKTLFDRLKFKMPVRVVFESGKFGSKGKSVEII